MAQVLHGCARTTAAVRRAIQDSQESVAALAERYNLNAKTVRKWRGRDHVADAPMAPNLSQWSDCLKSVQQRIGKFLARLEARQAAFESIQALC